MVIVLPGPVSRIAGLDFDAGGPKIGAAHLLSRTKNGFSPPSREEFDDMLRAHVEGSFDSKHAHERLASIAKLLDAGDVALAAIATSQLRLRKMPASDLDVASLQGRCQRSQAGVAGRDTWRSRRQVPAGERGNNG